jgi:hypothetical protein
VPKTEYVNVLPRNGSYALGVIVEGVLSLTASAAETATATVTVGPTTTASDVLDEMLLNMFVCPAPSTNPRSTWLTRLTMEETERVLLDLPRQSYPRAAPTSFSGAGSRTDTGTIFVPIGGPSGAIQIQPPPISNIFAANITTASVVYNVYVVSGENPAVVTYRDIQTPSLAINRQDFGTWFPPDMSPDVLIFANETTTTVNTLFITAQDGTVLVDMETTGPMAYAQGTVVPLATTSYNVLDFALAGKRFATFLANLTTTGARLLGFLQVSGAPASGVTPQPSAQTPATPAKDQVGAPNSAGVSTAAGSPGSSVRSGGGAGGIIKRG